MMKSASNPSAAGSGDASYGGIAMSNGGRMFPMVGANPGAIASRSGVLLPTPGSMRPQQAMMTQHYQGAYGDVGQNPYNVLLPPDHFIAPAGSHDDPVSHPPAPMMDLDISTSKFMNRMNFEDLSTGSHHGPLPADNSDQAYLGSDGRYGDGNRGDMADVDETSQYTISDDGDCLEQGLDAPDPDLLEQQQARAQTQLLDRFKQLRQWQVSQQEQLMRQQQEQLALLKDEQTRVQKMMVQQREATWGGTNGVTNKGLPVQPPSLSPPRVSPGKKPPIHPNTAPSGPKTVPLGPKTAAPTSAAMLARLGRLPGQAELSAEDSEAIPRPRTPVQVVKGRPLPGIVSGPSTPLEYLEHGNPNLDSDTGTLASGTPHEEGIARLADTASESSEPPDGTGYFTSRSDEPSDPGDNQGYGPPIPLGNRVVLGAATDPKGTISHPALRGDQFVLPPHMMPRQLPNGMYAGAMTNPSLSSMMMDPRLSAMMNRFPAQQPVMTSQRGSSQSEVLDFREEAYGQESYSQDTYGQETYGQETYGQETYGQEQPEVTEASARGLSEGEEGLDSRGVESDSYFEEGDPEDAEEMYEEEEEEDENTIEEKPVKLDDVPVVNKKKTFEELLEEELRKEEERMTTATAKSPPAAAPKTSQRRTFLKRGEGTARYGANKKSTTAAKHKTSTAKPQSKPEESAQNKKPMPPPSVKTVPKKVGPAAKKSGPTAKKSSPNKLRVPPPPVGKSTSPKTKPGVVSSTARPEKKPSAKQPAPAHPAVAMTTTSVPVSDSTGEVSFQRCMNKRAQSEEKETDALEEFEILEQFADDNASFLSSVSTVNRVLGQVHKKTVGSVDQQTQKVEASKSTNYQSSDSETLSEDSSQDDTIPGQYSSSAQQPVSGPRTIHRKVSSLVQRSPTKPDGGERRDRDQPIRAQHGIDQPIRAQHGSDQPIRSGHGSDQPIREQHSSDQPIRAQHGSDQQSRARHGSESSEDEWTDLNRNVLGKDTREMSGGVSEQEEEEEDEEEEDEESSESEEEEVSVKDILMNSKLRAQVPSNMQKQHSESVKHFSEKVHNAVQNAEPSQSATSVSPDHHTDRRQSHGDRRHGDRMSFGDDEEWGEEEGDQSEDSKQQKVQGPVIKTRVFPEQQSDPDTHTGTPPTSKLVTKLFPKLKIEKPAKLQPTQQQEQQLSEARQSAIGDGVQSKALRDKLAELEREIERFRRENAELERLRTQREEDLSHLKKEMAEFERQKSEELHRLQEYKAEETRKLKKERRVFDQYQKAARAMPDKRQRDEIEGLKKQLSDLHDELRRKETRWTSSSTRLRDRLEALERENAELKDEVKVVEKRRLEALQAKSQTAVFAPSVSRPATSSPIPSGPSAPKLHAATSLTGPHTWPQDPSSAPGPQIRPQDPPQSTEVLRLSANTDDSELMDSASQPDRPLAAMERTASHPRAEPLSSHPRGEPLSGSGAAGKLSLSPRLPPAPTGASTSQSAEQHSRSMSRKTAPAATTISTSIDKGDEKYEETQHVDGKIERVYTNGAREILFSNGTRKQVSADGQSILVAFFNGDMKQIMPDQRVMYYYADAQTTHTTYPDGLEIILFPSGQTEKHYPDGTREITFPDQIIKYLFPSGVEESIFPDGTVIRLETSGDKTMEFPNGQREVHTQQFKRREYPDGTVKTVYPDGRQETRYSSGRLRVKDIDGNIVVDRRV